MKINNKVVIILGPTASGKSELAVQIAQKFQGEIISADSRQIFKDVTINSGAVPLKNNLYKKIPHYLINFLDITQNFNVSHFQKKSTQLIKSIHQKEKLPIVCGGSLFWIKSLINNHIFPPVKPNLKLREKLNQQNTEKLFNQLKEKDPQRAQTIDPHNKVRLIRALEIIDKLGKVPPLESLKVNSNYLLIAPQRNWEELKKRIKKNIHQRMQQGMIEEIKNLHFKKKVSWKKIEKLGLSFRLIPYYLKGEIKTLEELEEKIYLAEKNYAKRQLTWLKKFPQVNYISNSAEVEELINNFIHSI